MVYRIGLTGAQGTGKSLVANAIVAQLQASGATSVQRCSGLGDRIAGAGLAVGERGDATTMRHFARAHQARELEATGALQVFDRLLLDTLAYARVLDCLGRSEFDALSRAAVASSRRFAQLLWLRVTLDYPVLNADDESPAFRRAIDGALGALARELGIALIEHRLPPDEPGIIARQVMRRYGSSQ